MRTAIGEAGLWDGLETDWLLLDAELMPWSLKASGLLRSQYAAVGAASGAVLPGALAALQGAAARGVDVTGPAGPHRANGPPTRPRSPRRTAATAGPRTAWTASAWHRSRSSRSRAAASPPCRTTSSSPCSTGSSSTTAAACSRPPGGCTSTPADPESVQAGVDWWLEMTGRGGEGMVVKPVGALVRDSQGRLVQPGIKCRGREYLRIIYGPEYTRPENLARLRSRFLNHKRSLAIREYALGLEALDRLAEGEPLWRVHEAVFGVLALESEPVDPRL